MRRHPTLLVPIQRHCSTGMQKLISMLFLFITFFLYKSYFIEKAENCPLLFLTSPNNPYPIDARRCCYHLPNGCYLHRRSPNGCCHHYFSKEHKYSEKGYNYSGFVTDKSGCCHCRCCSGCCFSKARTIADDLTNPKYGIGKKSRLCRIIPTIHTGSSSVMPTDEGR